MTFYHTIDAVLAAGIVISLGWAWLLERRDNKRRRR